MKFNVLLEGPAGTGKTTALRTLIPHVEKLCIIAAGESGTEALFGKSGKYPTDPRKVAWHYVPAARPSWDTMIDNARKINVLNYEQLTKTPNLNKDKYTQFLMLLEALSDFKDDRTGDKLGPVDSWPDTFALAVDGLSGVSFMAMSLVVGGKPAKSQPDWMIAQDLVYNLTMKLCGDTKCPFVLLSHIEREADEITGGTQITTSTLGRKLGPKLPPLFDEVILSHRNGNTFTWSTAAPNVDLKTRRLPIADGMAPDFGALFK